MPSDWTEADRRAFRYIIAWLAFAVASMIVRGVIAEYGDSEPGLGVLLSLAWVVAAIWMVLWTRRQRKRPEP